jgi:PAS domain S-box-containing protein
MEVGVTRCTRDLRYLWVSPSLAAWLGRTPEEIAGRPIVDVIGQEGYESILPHIERVLSGEREEYEAAVKYRDVGVRWIHAVYVPTRGQDHEVDGWIAVVLDVTARHEAEEALRASEARLKQAQRLAKVGSWERPLQPTGTHYWSDEMIRIVGLPYGSSGDFAEFLSHVHPKDREKVLEAERKIRSTGAPAEVEYRIIRTDGEVLFVRSVAEAVTDSTGVISQLIGATQDITEQVKARETVRESEARLKSAERLANVGHWDWDLNSNEVIWSDGTFRIFGRSRDYKPSYEDLLRATIPEDRARLNQVVTSSLAENSGFVVEFTITRPDGELRSVRSISEVSLDEERGLPVRMFGTVQDITDERRAEEASIAKQKWESLGRLAGGVAHDFNNLLGSALSQAELASAEIASGSNPEVQLQAIRDVAVRGSEIVHQLMVYAGKESTPVSLVDVSRVVEEMVQLLKVSVSKYAMLEMSLAKDLPAIPTNAAQIRQVVMNLVTNASEAIGDRTGVIRVGTEYVKARRGPSGAFSDHLADADYILLEVSDTGSGMSPETQAKVFEPFFTTKSTGHGLGLATVDGIVRNLRGKIHLTSEQGKGTTFRILLPCA